MDTEPASPEEMPTAQQLAHMQASGKVTPEEALAMKSGDDHERQTTMRGIRARHASARLDAAVAAGAISDEEAADLVQQVKHGTHSRALRSRINKLTRQSRKTSGQDDVL
jgi:hypothetical protein